jgi:hypothetical protein
MSGSLVVELLVASRNGAQVPGAVHTRDDDFLARARPLARVLAGER